MENNIPKTQVQLIPNKFYYLADNSPPKDIPNAYFFNIDNDLVYERFFEDFGPLNLSKIWKYISEVYKFLHEQKFSKNTFYHFTSTHYTKCTNSALLVCSYMIIVMNRTADEAFEPFENVEFRPFRDAGYHPQCTYKCTILDCLRGLHYAIKLGWFDYKKFDIAEYEHYEKIQNGDLNWIIPGKFVALSSPYDKQKDEIGSSFTPKDYVPIFKKMGVDSIVRLNNKTYDENEFKQRGVNHYELYFPDGTCPPKAILSEFLSIAEKRPTAIAVHCKAGLGRTGTLIAAYAIKHYHFHAPDFIGWIRLCRPGSILGPQQYFLLQSEEMLKAQGQNSPIWAAVKQKLTEQQVSSQLKNMNLGSKGKMSNQEKTIGVKGEKGQGNKLVQAKKEKLNKK